MQHMIRNKLEGNEHEIDKLIKFLDGIYLNNEKIKKEKTPDVSSEKVKG